MPLDAALAEVGRDPVRALGELRVQKTRQVIDRTDLAVVVCDVRDFGPFDVVLDPVGASYASHNLKLLAQDGRWVIIGLMGGRKAELDLALLLGKRIQLIGSTLRSRDADSKALLLAELEQQVWPLFAEGRLKPQLERSYPIAEAEAAWKKE